MKDGSGRNPLRPHGAFEQMFAGYDARLGVLIDLARLGEDDRPVVAMEQPHAKFGLQLLELATDRRLRKAHLLGGTREIEGFGYLDEYRYAGERVE